jgi:heterodisulfide reductase subunit A
VEREDRLGGNMAHHSGSYINFKAAPDSLQKVIERVMNHPYIQVLTRAHVMEVSGYVGNFKTHIQADGTDQQADQEAGEKASKFTFEVGAIIVATGWQRYDLGKLTEYGSGTIPDIVDGLTFEKMLGSGDPIRRSSDGKIVREIVFVQCAGSRDREHGVAYCSKVCCMTVAKQAMLYRERVPNGQAYVFYIDIRSAGKGYDEYVQQAMTDHQVLYLRGKVSKVFRESDEPGSKVIVWGVDTLSDRTVEIAADLVVLATPMFPAKGSTELGQLLHISTDAYGFYNEAHPKLRPVETLTAGIFLAGVAQGPKDIPETVAQASGAAAKVLQLFSKDEMTASPMVATVIEELCAACGACVEVCPYGAREIHPVWNIARVNAALCQNCGACVVACPNKASQIHNWRPTQILAMIDEVL